jgi:hypothetical protein
MGVVTPRCFSDGFPFTGSKTKKLWYKQSKQAFSPLCSGNQT